jgi:ribosomal protein L11 methyltransferase
MKETLFVRVTVEVVDEARLALLDFLAELSPAGVVEESEWEGVRVPACVYLPREGSEGKLDRLEGYLDFLRELWGGGAVLSYEAVEVADPGWTTEYRRYFTAQRITSRIVVRPPWEAYPAREGDIVITILPGPAFGTGTHETTRLCLAAIEEICAARRIETMLDVGCGSAILSIAGALLGIGRVKGVEADPQAVESARENAARNGFGDDRVTVVEETFTRAGETFDLVVANLTSGEIAPVIDALFASAAPGGFVVLSGILDIEEGTMRAVIDKHRPAGRPDPSVRRQGEWLCFEIGPDRPIIPRA